MKPKEENKEKFYQMLEELMNSGDYQGVYDIAKRSEFSSDFKIQEFKIYALIKLNALTKARKLAQAPRFHNYVPIQVLLVKALIELNDLKQAQTIASNKRFEGNADMYAERIIIYLKRPALSTAYELASNEEYKENPKIQYLHIACLISMYRFDEALEIAENPAFINNSQIQEIKKRAENRKAGYHKFKEKNKLLNEPLLRKTLEDIKHQNITPEEIEAIELSTFKKKMLHVVYLYQNNYPSSLIATTLKRLQEEYKDNSLATRCIKHFLELIKQKRRFYDIEAFIRLLNQDFEEEKISR